MLGGGGDVARESWASFCFSSSEGASRLAIFRWDSITFQKNKFALELLYNKPSKSDRNMHWKVCDYFCLMRHCLSSSQTNQNVYSINSQCHLTSLQTRMSVQWRVSCAGSQSDGGWSKRWQGGLPACLFLLFLPSPPHHPSSSIALCSKASTYSCKRLLEGIGKIVRWHSGLTWFPSP